MKEINVGLMGLGTVGRGVYELLRRNAGSFEHNLGARINVRKILVRNLNKQRTVDSSLLTTNPGEILNDDNIDTVIELIGGENPAYDHIKTAISRGKNVITANKLVLSKYSTEFFELARQKNVKLGFEASVCGAIPVIRVILSGLAGNQISYVYGILNGTTNYILTQMSQSGTSYADALGKAQQLGFAEADPSLDVDGLDAAQKLCILAQLSFQVPVTLDNIDVAGIRELDQGDISYARAQGCEIKLIAFARSAADHCELVVSPMFIPKPYPIANVLNEYNAVVIKGDAAGELILYGKGAGSLPTASSVISDLVTSINGTVAGSLPNVANKKFQKHDGEWAYYLRVPIYDKPGVIGIITTAIGESGLSISGLSAELQKDKRGYGVVRIMLHPAQDFLIRKVVSIVSRQPVITGKPQALRVLDSSLL